MSLAGRNEKNGTERFVISLLFQLTSSDRMKILLIKLGPFCFVSLNLIP